jgi:DNA-binding response OmpR family regulator
MPGAGPRRFAVGTSWVADMNHAYYDDADNIVLWNPKPASRRNSTRSVIVLHSDDAAGEIIALRLRSEGFGAVHQSDVATVELMLDYWRPCALLIDTRSATDEEFRFVGAAAANPMLDQTLLIAITDPALKGTTIEARKLGFDGLCPGPCLVWRLAEMLDYHLSQAR